MSQRSPPSGIANPTHKSLRPYIWPPVLDMLNCAKCCWSWELMRRFIKGDFWWYLESPRYRQVWWCMVGTNRSLCLNKTAHQSESSGWLTLDWCAKFVVTFVVVTWLWFYVGFYEGFLCGRSEFGEFLMSCLHFFASFPRWWIGCPDQYL